MKKFAIKIFLFSGIIIAIVFLCDVWLRTINTSYKLKWEGLRRSNEQIEVLVLGNSHANYGVDPRQFKYYTFNAANVLQSLYFDKRITLANLPELKKLKYVLISVDYHSLYYSSQGYRDTWSYYANGIKYSNKDYLKDEISPFLFGYSPTITKSLMKKFISRKIHFPSELNKCLDIEDGVNPNDSVVNGFIHYDQTVMNFTDSAAEKRADFFNSLINDSSNTNANKSIVEDLDSFLAQLIAKGVKPILFSTPTYFKYNKLLKKEILARNKEQIDILTKKYAIEFWDYANQSTFTEADFFNVDHLNIGGATKFSKLLNQQLLLLESKK